MIGGIKNDVNQRNDFASKDKSLSINTGIGASSVGCDLSIYNGPGHNLPLGVMVMVMVIDPYLWVNDRQFDHDLIIKFINNVPNQGEILLQYAKC